MSLKTLQQHQEYLNADENQESFDDQNEDSASRLDQMDDGDEDNQDISAFENLDNEPNNDEMDDPDDDIDGISDDLFCPKSEDINSQTNGKNRNRNNSSRRNPRAAASRIDKYNVDSDVDENDEEMDIEMGQDSLHIESVDNDEQDNEQDEGAQEGEEDEEQSDRDERVLNSTNNGRKPLPIEAKENMKKSREMVDSGLNQLYQLKLKELDAEEELIKHKSHPEYHKKLAHLLERKDRNLKRAQDRLARATENYRKTLDCCIQEATETLSSAKRALRQQFINAITRDRYAVSESLENPYEKIQAFIALPKDLREKKRARMDDCLEGLADESDTPSWTLHLVKKRRRAGYDNLWAPLTCLGLDSNEVKEDLEFLKTVLNTNHDSSTNEPTPLKSEK